MNFEEAREVLIRIYSGMGFQIEDSSLDVIQFSKKETIEHVNPITDETEGYVLEHDYEIEKEYIAEFASLRTEIENNNIQITGSNLISPSYREQALSLLGGFTTLSSLEYRRFFHESFHFLNDENGLKVEIGPASEKYVMNFLADDEFQKAFSVAVYGRFQTGEGYFGMSSRAWPFTIRVRNVNANTISDCTTKTNKIVDSCLYYLSSKEGLYLNPTDKFSKSHTLGMVKGITDKKMQIDIRKDPEVLDLPHAFYNHDLIRYYWLAGTTHIDTHQFLAYYQILEYHFQALSDKELYGQIRKTIHTPSFSTTKPFLDLIINSVEKHRRETDDKEMLKLVFRTYLQDEEVIEFIKKYEKENQPQYTKRRSVFGNVVQIHLKPNHVWSGLAETIRTIRNALVHSSDKYERTQRYVPFTQDTDVVKDEIPLMRFLAEQVIVATSEPFDLDLI